MTIWIAPRTWRSDWGKFRQFFLCLFLSYYIFTHTHTLYLMLYNMFIITIYLPRIIVLLSLNCWPLVLNLITHLDFKVPMFVGIAYWNAYQSPMVEHEQLWYLQSKFVSPVKHFSLLRLTLVCERPFKRNSTYNPYGGESELQFKRIVAFLIE